MQKKKQRLVQTKPDETTVHPVGQERFISVQKYVGDLPSGEPNDWFEAPEEREALREYELEKLLEYELAGYDPSEANELLEDEWLIDEY